MWGPVEEKHATRRAAVVHPSLLREASPGLHMGVSLIAAVGPPSGRAEGRGAPGETNFWGGGFVRQMASLSSTVGRLCVPELQRTADWGLITARPCFLKVRAVG